MTSDFSDRPPDVAGGDAEAERVSEAASAGKLPWAKPTIWIGSLSATNAGTQINVSETQFYYVVSA